MVDPCQETRALRQPATAWDSLPCQKPVTWVRSQLNQPIDDDDDNSNNNMSLLLLIIIINHRWLFLSKCIKIILFIVDIDNRPLIILKLYPKPWIFNPLQWSFQMNNRISRTVALSGKIPQNPIWLILVIGVINQLSYRTGASHCIDGDNML